MGKITSEGTRQRMSETRKQLWADPDFAARMLKANSQTPNGPESTLLEMLEDKWPRRFQSNLDGGCAKILWSWGYRGRNHPDIVRIDGFRQVIFSNGHYWHQDDTEEAKLIRDFGLHGIDCIVLWADSWADIVVDWPGIVRRIDEKTLA